MKNRQRSLAKVVTAVVMGLFMVMAFSSLGLAQEAKVLKDAAKMMSDAWKMFDDGQRFNIRFTFKPVLPNLVKKPLFER